MAYKKHMLNLILQLRPCLAYIFISLALNPISGQNTFTTQGFSGIAFQLGNGQENYRYSINNSLQYERKNYNPVYIHAGIRKNMGNRGFGEFALSQLYFRKREDILRGSGPADIKRGSVEKDYGMALRFQYGYLLNKNKAQRFQPALGTSIDPFFNYFRQVPKTSAGFPLKSWRAGGEWRFIPQLMYQLSGKLALNAAIPVRLANFYHEQQTVENPILTETQRTERFTKLDGGLQEWQFLVAVYFGLN